VTTRKKSTALGSVSLWADNVINLSIITSTEHSTTHSLIP